MVSPIEPVKTVSKRETLSESTLEFDPFSLFPIEKLQLH